MFQVNEEYETKFERKEKKRKNKTKRDCKPWVTRRWCNSNNADANANEAEG